MYTINNYHFINRLKSLLTIFIVLWSLSLTDTVFSQPIQITDILGRKVTLDKPAKHIVLAQARYLPILSLIRPDAANLLVGWSDEFKTAYSNEYQAYLDQFPKLANLPIIAKHNPSTFSIEKTIALQPDLVILTSAFAGVRSKNHDSLIIDTLTKAHIPVLVVDFFTRPMENTVPSLKILGQALGEEQRTQDFIQLYQQHMDIIAQRIEALDKDDRPSVLVHVHAGSTPCCNSPGLGTFNEMIRFAGGHNIGQDVLKGPFGALNFEYILKRNPHIYIATGTGSPNNVRSSGLIIGYGASPQDAVERLKTLITNQKLDKLQAILSGNAHGIWHGFNDSPLHVVFIEALARWIHPDLFHDISPEATLKEINERFLSVPMQGSYMINLPATKINK